MLVIAWIHGSIGLYFWLRMKAFFKRAAPFLLAAAVLVPTLAMLGLYQGGRTVIRDSDSAQWQADNLSPRQVGTPAEGAVLDEIIDYFLIGYLGLIGLVLLAKGRARPQRAPRRHDQPVLWQWPHGPGAEGPQRAGSEPAPQRPACQRLRRPRPLLDLPHSRDRGLRRTAGTVAARSLRAQPRRQRPIPRSASPASCGPTTDLSFFQLFMPHTMSANAHASQPHRIGQERYLVSMFVDMRGSTQLAEKRLPFDTVFIVNRFLGAVSQAVIECGGQPNQFVGDGELALFGLRTSPQIACRQALKAAAMIAANVDELNQFLSHDLREPIRFGIGIHGGEVIIGDIGYRDHMVFTALGDAVNVAARLQDMTKNLGLRSDLLGRRSASPPVLPPSACRSRKSRSAAAPSR